MNENVILVDENDTPIGTEEKMKAHEKALCHRAFSILIFNKNNNMLIHQRAKHKYHCPGLWTNACCSHPRQGEITEDAAHRRLKEEMGFDTKLDKLFYFHYTAEFDNGLTENELDYVFKGIYDQDPNINKDEIEDYRWISIEELKQDIKQNPEIYTPWFKIIIKKLDV